MHFRLRQQAGLRLKSYRADLRLDKAPRSRLVLLRLVLDLEVHYRDSRRGVAQRAQLDDLSADPNLVQAARASAGRASAGFASPGLNSPRSISDFDFSSRIIGEGVVTAFVILTIRWRSTASLNLNECSSSASVSLSHSMFMST